MRAPRRRMRVPEDLSGLFESLRGWPDATHTSCMHETHVCVCVCLLQRPRSTRRDQMITEPSSGASGSTTPGTGLYFAVGHFTFAIGKIGQKLVLSQKCDGSCIMLDMPARTARRGHPRGSDRCQREKLSYSLPTKTRRDGAGSVGVVYVHPACKSHMYGNKKAAEQGQTQHVHNPAARQRTRGDASASTTATTQARANNWWEVCS